jgi:hypothetical protein
MSKNYQNRELIWERVRKSFSGSKAYEVYSSIQNSRAYFQLGYIADDITIKEEELAWFEVDKIINFWLTR